MSATLLYSLHITHAALWYDEAVEYFYSKYMTGSVPGSFGTNNMYERICSTFQPPLYNFLMYFWLKIFDSEAGFRMAGILTTMVGSVGIFKAIEVKTKDILYPNAGVCIYLCTSAVAYYGLECGEYNLMLCFVSWTLYFFLRCLEKADTSSLIGFFLFACLSVYSQYGAAFVIIGLFISLFIRMCSDRNTGALKSFVIISAVVGIFIALPLIFFFLIPQMTEQSSALVSHTPVFVHNCFFDYFWGIFECLAFSFRAYTNFTIGTLFVIASLVIILFSGFAAIKKKDDFSFLMLAFFLTFTMYYIAVMCSVYGYNSFEPDRLGCNNIGGRYSLFLAPIVVVSNVIGFKAVSELFRDSKIMYKAVTIIGCLGLIGFCGTEFVKLTFIPWLKDDLRELSYAWYNDEAYNSHTLIHQWNDATFHYYLFHNDNYSDEYKDNIQAVDVWIKTADAQEIEQYLKDNGYLSMSDFYYISPTNGSYYAFIDTVTANGYSIEEVYKEKSSLLHMTK